MVIHPWVEGVKVPINAAEFVAARAVAPGH
jgi:hypothetical protein